MKANRPSKLKRARTERVKPRSVQRVVRAQMRIHADGTVSFNVRGYDFRWADTPIAVNGYLFAPVRPNAKVSDHADSERGA